MFLFIGHFGFSQIEDEFIARSITYQGTTLPYRLFIPANYSESKKYPLVLTLHGVGESGTDNYSQLLNTRLATSWADPVNQINYPCFVLSPQTNSGWDNIPVMETISKILDSLINEFTIDSNRLYVTGLSMGGVGTWAIITHFPNLFAAAIPMCGSGNPGIVTAESVTPIWNFHGTVDNIIPVGRSREMIGALESIGRSVVYTHCQITNCLGLPDSTIEMYIKSHADLFYTEYEFGTHNIWDKSYDNPMLRPWVFDKYLLTPGAIAITNLDSNKTLNGIEKIRWQSPADGDSVEIWYSPDAGDTWKLVSRSEPDIGSYEWDTRNFRDGEFELLNVFLKNNEGFIYSRDQSDYFAIDNEIDGTLNQTITFDPPAPVTYGVSPFTLNARASSGLPVYYSSSKTSVAIVSGDTVTIVGAGTATITASQSGDANFKVAANVDQTMTVEKATQAISFATIVDVPESTGLITLVATSSSGLATTFSSNDASVATISGNTATLKSAGEVTFTAAQTGNANYKAAPSLTQSICILPNMPTATGNFANPAAPELTSSSANGNQWFLNANSIDGAINTTYMATIEGIYTVQVTLKGCRSPVSHGITIIITGLEDPFARGLYPNPATNEITYSIRNKGQTSIEIINDLGQSLKQLKDVRAQEIKIDISDLSAGSYIVKVMQGDRLQAFRFIKN